MYSVPRAMYAAHVAGNTHTREEIESALAVTRGTLYSWIRRGWFPQPARVPKTGGGYRSLWSSADLEYAREIRRLRESGVPISEAVRQTREGGVEWRHTADAIRDALGVASTTLWGYVRRGMFPAPRRLSRGAVGGIQTLWNDEDLERARAFRELRESGLSPTEVAATLARQLGEPRGLDL